MPLQEPVSEWPDTCLRSIVASVLLPSFVAMVAGIERRLFEGESEKGKVPKYSLNDLDDEHFKYVALKCNTSSHQYFLSDQYNCQNIDTVVINTVAVSSTVTLHQIFMYSAMDLKYN